MRRSSYSRPFLGGSRVGDRFHFPLVRSYYSPFGISPSDRFPTAFHTAASVSLLIKRADPSANAVLNPPGWWLPNPPTKSDSATSGFGAAASSLFAAANCGFGI